MVGSDGGAAHPCQQLAGALAAARFDDEQNDEVEHALAGHHDEDGADAGQFQTEVVVVARHAQCTAVACSDDRRVVHIIITYNA